MYNPILAHRQEVVDRILKGFDDVIEKSPQLIRRNHHHNPKDVVRYTKNGAIVLSKNNTEYYVPYNKRMKRSLVVGEDEITPSGRHITKNTDKSKRLMVYTEKMKAELFCRM